MEKSDHFDGTRFINPTGPTGQPWSAVLRLFLEKRAPWPERIDEAPRQPSPLDGASAVVTHIGHATFLIQTGAGNILIDPMYSRRAGPLNLFGPRRVREPAVRFEDLPPISTVLLSHNHYDHCDVPTLRRLARRFDPLVVTPLGNAPLVRSCGIRHVEEIDWWQQARTPPMSIVLTPAQHYSTRVPWDRQRALWGGFAIGAGGKRIYYAADTAYAPFLREIPQRIGPIDLALLPIGAYEPRWFMQAVHMNPAEAVQAHLDTGAARSIAMHYGVFPLTNEAIDEPLIALDEALRARNIPPSRFGVVEFGESVRL